MNSAHIPILKFFRFFRSVRDTWVFSLHTVRSTSKPIFSKGFYATRGLRRRSVAAPSESAGDYSARQVANICWAWLGRVQRCLGARVGEAA